MKWISTATLLVALGVGLSGSRAMAQQASDAPAPDDLRARLEQQQAQINQLQSQLTGMQQVTPAAPVAYDMAGGTAAAAPAGPKWVEVGSDMNAKTWFKDGSFLNFATPNNDFTMHLGGWVQWDNVQWHQTNNLSAAQGVTVRSGTNSASLAAGANGLPGIASGAAPGGIGVLQDGEYWRRVRLVMEGTFQETYEYRFNWAFENDQFSTVGLDEFWIGDSKIPVIGTVRVGHVKTPMGLEGDMTSSSRCMTFMERSAYSESIELNQNFGNGIWFSNTAFDDRMMGAFSLFRPDNSGVGDYLGDGQYGWQGRITGLPIYEDEGRELLHLGVSGGWRNGSGNPNASSVTLSARPEMRDDDPGAQTIQPLPNANDSRMINTGAITCNEEYIMGLELLYILGPASVQAEYGWNFLENATNTPANSVARSAGTDYVFSGGYLQFAYTLTGENRAYSKRDGGLSRYYFGSHGPNENAYIVRADDGSICSGRGAWEVATRLSYVDLDSGPSTGSNRVQGGIMNGVGVALNWYLNTNLSIMNDLNYNYRYDLPAAGTIASGTFAGQPVAGTVAGSTVGWGTEVQLQW